MKVYIENMVEISVSGVFEDFTGDRRRLLSFKNTLKMHSKPAQELFISLYKSV